jgi:c-di-GMP-binding flagellar brake protein YcgR
MTVNDKSPIVTRKGQPRPSDAVVMIREGDEPHEMTDPFDIGEALDQLAETGEPVSIYAGRAREPIMARLESVDPELPHFVLDLAGDATLPTEHTLTVVASLGNNAKMQFELPSDWKIQTGNPHLVNCTFPEVCLVLNRRSEKRYESPVGGNYTATFIMLGQKRSLQLYDFSMHGVAMRAEPRHTMGLRVGKKLDAVRLDIGDEFIVVDMMVRSVRRFRTFLLGEQVQIGCQFSNMSAQTEQKINAIISAHDAPRKSAAHA